jgi:spore germination protein GerM
MNDNNNSKSGFLAGVIVAAIAVGSGSAWLAHNYLSKTSEPLPESVVIPTSPTKTENPTPAVSPTPPETNVKPTTTPTETGQKPATIQGVFVYWVNPAATQDIELQPTKLILTKKTAPKEILETAFQQLLSGQNDRGYTTTIPTGTKLLSLKTDGEGVRINLSGDFVTGGGSESMVGRLGQVIYTATTLDPNGKVWIDVDGKPLEYLGGEGIEVVQPMTRTLFLESF